MRSRSCARPAASRASASSSTTSSGPGGTSLAARVVLPLITRNRYTRTDGPMSVRRAYTRIELRALLAGADLRPVAESVAIGGHRVAIAAVPIRGASRTAPLPD